jgi:hypothetical protein
VKAKDVPLETGADIMWNAGFEWEYESDELAFLRYLCLGISFTVYVVEWLIGYWW